MRIQVPRQETGVLEPPPIVAGRLTVALCTHNRSWLLRGALEALTSAQPAARSDWEVVVVLNDCSDDSAATAAQFASRLPLIVESEPRTGHSHARNRAIDVASGEYMLWIDDDVRVCAGYLPAYRDAIAQRPDASFFAGPIRPLFEGSPPDWLLRALPTFEPAFAATAEHPHDEAITSASLPYGANFGVRTSVQRRYRYDPELGRGPVGWMRSGDESDVLTRILLDGGTGFWIAGATVDHYIPADRQTVDYVRRYFEGCGRTEGIMKRRSRRRSWAAAPIDLLAAVVADLRFAISRRYETPERWSWRLVKAAVRRGRLKANFSG